MSMLIRLYPRAWRDRYEAEVLDLLMLRGGSVRVALDLVRGAIDAHLHPQSGPPVLWTHRLPGLFSLLAGLSLSLAVLGISFRAGPDWGAAGNFMGVGVMLMLVSLPGDYLARQGRRLVVAGGVFGACVVAANLLGPGVSSSLFGSVAVLLVICGILATAALRAGIAARGRWILVAAGVILPLLLVAGVTLVRESTGVALVDIAASTTALFGLPYGLAWLLVGLRMTVRGSPTKVDQPSPATPGNLVELEIPT